MSNILLIKSRPEPNKLSGREKLSASIERVILKINPNLFVYKIPKNTSDLISRSYLAAQGMIDGADQKQAANIINIIKLNDISHVFIDGSNYGYICRQIKLSFTNVKIFVFFHNCEAKFFWDLFIYKKSIKSFIVFIINYLSEKTCCLNSDELICMTEDDINEIKKKYGVVVKHKIPMFIGNSYFYKLI